MSEPIVFISHNTVKDGKLEGFRKAFGEVAGALEAEKPGTIVYLAFADEGRSRVSVVHVFPDAGAMGRHLLGVQERMAKAVGFIDTTGYEIYGTPSQPALEAMRGFAQAQDVPLHVQPDYVGGYVRPGGQARAE
jgi:quinol monooxygenase YgiN